MGVLNTGTAPRAEVADAERGHFGSDEGAELSRPSWRSSPDSRSALCRSAASSPARRCGTRPWTPRRLERLRGTRMARSCRGEYRPPCPDRKYFPAGSKTSGDDMSTRTTQQRAKGTQISCMLSVHRYRARQARTPPDARSPLQTRILPATARARTRRRRRAANSYMLRRNGGSALPEAGGTKAAIDPGLRVWTSPPRSGASRRAGVVFADYDLPAQDGDHVAVLGLGRRRGSRTRKAHALHSRRYA